MREHIRHLVSSARRAARTTSAPPHQRHDQATADQSHASHGLRLGADAVRLARVAAAIHMAQAAGRPATARGGKPSHRRRTPAATVISSAATERKS